MGKEIIVEGWTEDGKKLAYKNENYYILGRDDATSFVSNYIQNHGVTDHKTLEKLEKESGQDLCPFVDFKPKSEELIEFKKELECYEEKDHTDLYNARMDLEDLRAARQHAPNLKTFDEYDTVIEETRDLIDRLEWSNAENLLSYIMGVEDQVGMHVCGKDGEEPSVGLIRIFVSE